MREAVAVTPTPTHPDVLTRLETAFDDPDRITLSHARALTTLEAAHRPLTYAELTRALNLSGRQTRSVVGDLERHNLIDRHAAGDSTAPDRFEAVL